MSKRLTYEDVVAFVKRESTCILLSTEYINYETKLSFQCKCGKVFETSFSKFKNRNKRQCNECSWNAIGDNLQLKYKDIKDFVETNSDCKLVSKNYKNAHTKMIFKCGCENEFTTTFSLFKWGNKRQCDACGKQPQYDILTKSDKIFKNEVYNLVGDEYTFLDNYINAQTKLRCQHNKDDCDYIWKVKPSHFINTGSRCPKCAIIESSQKRTKTHEEFVNDVFSCVQDEYSVIDNYTNAKTKIKMRHNICGYEYYVTPNNFLDDNNRCPRCIESKGEQRIRNYLENNDSIILKSQYTIEECRNERPLPFDFAMFDRQFNLLLLIEYDGIHHFEPIEHWGGQKCLEYRQHNDFIKNDYCKNNDIQLLRIPYWELDNIEKILENWIDKI